MRIQQLSEDDLNKRSAKYANKLMLVARGADIQLYPSCVPPPLETNVKRQASNIGHVVY